MGKKSLSSMNNSAVGINDAKANEDEVKFICEFNEYSLVMPKIDEKGEVVYAVDAKGNNKLPVTVTYKFTKIPAHKNIDGKIDPTNASCYFVASKSKHGADFDRIVAKLDKDCKNPSNKMYREDAHWKKRNPEAFRIATEKAELESKLSDKDQKIAELERKLGFKNKG